MALDAAAALRALELLRRNALLSDAEFVAKREVLRARADGARRVCGSPALAIACQHGVVDLSPDETVRALTLVNRDVGLSATALRRRRRDARVALANEIRRHELVVTRTPGALPPYNGANSDWWYIHGVVGKYAILEKICMRYDKTRFCIKLFSLDEWPAWFSTWADDEDYIRDEWEGGFLNYGEWHN